jgi:hypothetical protein
MGLDTKTDCLTVNRNVTLTLTPSQMKVSLWLE